MTSKKTHVKRPMNCFMVWSREKRCQILQENPGINNARLSKLLGMAWKKLSVEEKEPYIEKAKHLTEMHKEKHPDYKYQPKRRKSKSSKEKGFDAQGVALNISSACGGRGSEDSSMPFVKCDIKQYPPDVQIRNSIEETQRKVFSTLRNDTETGAVHHPLCLPVIGHKQTHLNGFPRHNQLARVETDLNPLPGTVLKTDPHLFNLPKSCDRFCTHCIQPCPPGLRFHEDVSGASSGMQERMHPFIREPLVIPWHLPTMRLPPFSPYRLPSRARCSPPGYPSEEPRWRLSAVTSFCSCNLCVPSNTPSRHGNECADGKATTSYSHSVTNLLKK